MDEVKATLHDYLRQRRRDLLGKLDGLATSHKKEWVRWVTDAKKPETRTARIEKTVDGLRAGKKTH